MPAVSTHDDEQSKQPLLHGLLSEDHHDDTGSQRTASLQEVASQFCWMGWIALPNVYIGLFQSVSFVGCSMVAIDMSGQVRRADADPCGAP